jgi:drug/metabolite transporter (DMT)-like permease
VRGQGRSDPAALTTRRIPTDVLGIAFVVLWCTGYPTARIALNHCGPFTLLVGRFAGAALAYTLLALHARAPWPRGAAARHTLAIGLLQLALQFGAVYLAVSLGVNVGLVALVLSTMPIMTALFGLVLGAPISALQWIGFVFGFAGVALAVGANMHLGGPAGLGAYLSLALGLLGVTFGTIYQKRHGGEVDLRSGLAVQHFVAMLALLPLALHEGLRMDGSPTLFAALAWMVLVNSLCGFALFYVLLRRGAVHQVAALFFLMPPVTAVLDYFVLRDALTSWQLAGIATAAFGVWLATRSAAVPAPEACSGC